MNAVMKGFVMLPRDVVYNSKTKNLSGTDVHVFSILLDMFSLSKKNKESYSDEGGIFVLIPRKRIAELVNRSVVTVTNSLKNLIKSGLISEKRVGLTQCNRIYVNESMLNGMLDLNTEKKEMEQSKQTEENKAASSHEENESFEDSCEGQKNSEVKKNEQKKQFDSVEKQIEADELRESPVLRPYIAEIIKVMNETYHYKQNKISINNDKKPINYVRHRFRKLNKYHIREVISTLANSKVDINNRLAYIRTLLYNIIDNYEPLVLKRISDMGEHWNPKELMDIDEEIKKTAEYTYKDEPLELYYI